MRYIGRVSLQLQLHADVLRKFQFGGEAEFCLPP
jgi:hypothetical protein